MYARIASRSEENEMTPKDNARLTIMKMILACGGQPATEKLSGIFDKFNAGQDEPTELERDIFDTTIKSDYPGLGGECLVPMIIELVGNGVPPPPPMTDGLFILVYVQYVFHGGPI